MICIAIKSPINANNEGVIINNKTEGCAHACQSYTLRRVGYGGDCHALTWNRAQFRVFAMRLNNEFKFDALLTWVSVSCRRTLGHITRPYAKGGGQNFRFFYKKFAF